MAENAKYKQIVDFIRHGIEKGDYLIGEQIPTEIELCKMFDFSRMTVNKALTELAKDEYIERIPGKGSFVTALHVKKSFNSAASFTQDMNEIGLKAGSKLISYKLIKGEDAPKIAQSLELREDDYIHYFIRLRTGGNKPIAISYTYISAKIVPAIDVTSLNDSFYAFLKKQNINPRVANFEIRATLPTQKQKELLNVDKCALLCSQHLTYDYFEGICKPFEYVETYYNGEIYSYTISQGCPVGNIDS